jgi:UDP-N-acetylglucosamine 3-dehydrogenase
MKIGLIGLGYWGQNYLRVLRMFEGVELCYVCDKEASKLSKALGVKLCSDPEIMAEDKELDAVVVATPASTHYEIVKVSLEAGKHVLVEKPFTTSYEQAVELSKLSEDVGKILMVGHIYCFNPAVNYIKSILTSKELGTPYYGIGLRLGLGPIRYDASCTWDLAVHDISILDYLLGETPSEVSARAVSFLQKHKGIYDHAMISLKYPSGFHFSLTVNWYAPEKLRLWYLVGSRGMIKFDDVNKNAQVTIFRKTVRMPAGSSATKNEINLSIEEGETIIPHITQEEPLLLQVKSFIDAIKNGTKPTSDGWQGARVVRVLEAIEKSIRIGKSVRIEGSWKTKCDIR